MDLAMEEEEILRGKPIIDVEPLSKDFDPSGIPKTAMDYIHLVQHEAQHCPKVVVADIDVGKFRFKQTPYFFPNPKADGVLEELLPSMDWQNDQVADFSEVRNAVVKMKQMGIDRPQHIKDFICSLPESYSKKSWFQICVGNPVDPIEDETECKGAKPKHKGKKHMEPLLSLVTGISHTTLTALLDYHVSWLKSGKTTFDDSAQWIYALLACLEIPLTPDICSSLRALSRVAAETRSQLTSVDDKRLVPLNLFICLVGRYFKQFDLAD